MIEITVPPKVSILIPVYNREEFIGECIQSALNQTFRSFEVIVVDNASTDKTWEICQEFAHKDSRVKIFRNDINIGPVRNWLACMDNAVGLYGKILFSDDLMYPTYLECTIPLIENAEVGFVYTAADIGEKPPKNVSRPISASHNIRIERAVFIENACVNGSTPVSPGAAIFWLEDLKKNLMLNIPSPSFSDFSSLGAGPDLLLYLLTANQYRYVFYVNEKLVFFRSHSSSITIREKSHIGAQYNQARLWFVDEHVGEEMLVKVIARTWLSDCKRRQKLLLPSHTLKNYFFQPPQISLLRFCYFATQIAISEILTRLLSSIPDKLKP